MNHRHALWLTTSLLLGLAARLLAAAAHPHPDPGPPPTRCGRWVQVGSPQLPLVCLDRRPATTLRRAGVTVACLQRHAPRTIRPGDRLDRPGSASCRLGRMHARLIAALGLPVDINRAGAPELATLPGVGPGLARRIRNHRRRHGPFRRAEDLLSVRGIGPRLLRRLRARVATLEPAGARR